MTGKNTRTAAIIIFESGLSVPNQLFMSGANATIGIGVGGDRERHQRRARAEMNRAVINAAPTPATGADHQPAERLDERRQP